jgi:hypothetical protein
VVIMSEFAEMLVIVHLMDLWVHPKGVTSQNLFVWTTEIQG